MLSDRCVQLYGCMKPSPVQTHTASRCLPDSVDEGVPCILELQVVVIGSGIGGLSAAAMLAMYGERVTVVESHDIPGGCAHGEQLQGASLLSSFAAAAEKQPQCGQLSRAHLHESVSKCGC